MAIQWPLVLFTLLTGLGVGVFSLPIALTIYAFRLYVEQTKAQMARLEEIIAERINDLKKANEKLGTERA